MKKIIALVLTVFMAVAVFAACSAPETAASESPSEAASTEPSADASESAEASDEGAAAGSLVDKIEEAGELVLLTNAQFPPYEYLGDDNQPTGVDIEIAQKIADELGVKLTVVDMDFDGLVPALNGGKGDFIAAGYTITEERQQSVDFSDEYATSNQMVIVTKDDPKVAGATVEDLAGKTIGVQLGTTGDLFVSDEVEGATVKQYKSAIEAGMDLANGKLDAVVVDKLPAQSIVANNDSLTVYDDVLTTEQYAMAVRKGESDDLLEVINKVLADMKGDIQDLTQKHFDQYSGTSSEAE
ncbi:transporter substrate-binding domain-containing protein [Christensenella timonensis]|uniref:transporter substrate-binding domain-containing protein n=1 Tax=Christensenella timonensis TaxID=1816678 RepID=UPI00082C4F86|nr:transporter substrate-binding domain-containing protein [Christensenella timonensis]